MMEPIETIVRGNKRAEIYYDELAESPRTFMDGWLGKMVCAHKRHSYLGDEQLNIDEFGSWDEVEDYLFKECGANIILPLSLYDHSGITMSVGVRRGWDCGQVGFIYTTEEKCKNVFGIDYTDDKVTEALINEVEIYDHYLTGEVYGFKIFENKHKVNKCPHCNEIVDEKDEDEEIDACWGFYGMKDVTDAAEEAMV